MDLLVIVPSLLSLCHPLLVIVSSSLSSSHHRSRGIVSSSLSSRRCLVIAHRRHRVVVLLHRIVQLGTLAMPVSHPDGSLAPRSWLTTL